MRELIAIDGERWDTICLRAYNKSNHALVKHLRAHNRALVRQYSFALPGGAKVVIPELDAKENEPNITGLAPWQQ
ncbi:TPA: tail protein X [Vibrio harveyi]